MRSKLFLLKVLEVQKTYRAHKREGVSNVYVYRTYIREQFWISERTFYRFLEIPAARDLEKLNKVKGNG